MTTDQRTTSSTSMLVAVLWLLSSCLICLAEAQNHISNIPVLDLSQPPFTHNFVPDIFPPPAVTPDPLEYLGGQSDDFTEAVYAALFAKELRRLETHENDIFTNFITDGFVSEEVPRHLPKLLIRLSRKALRTGFFDQTGSGVSDNGLNSVHNSIHGRRGRSGSAVVGVGAPPATIGRGLRGALLPIEKGRLVTKTTTTDFGSIIPLLSSRTGRIRENNFRFPSEPTHTRSFLSHKSQFTY